MTKIVVFALLLPLLFMNFGMGLSRAFARRLGTLTSRWVPESEVAAPQVEALRLRLERMLRIVKLAVGVLGLLLGMYALVSMKAISSIPWSGHPRLRLCRALPGQSRTGGDRCTRRA